MMNRFIYLFLLLGCVASALVGCTDDPNVDPLPAGSVGKGTSWVTIDFSDNSFDEVNITTRATLDNVAESRVANLFIFIFGPKDETGNAKRLYGRYFDHSNRVDSEADLLEAKSECWWVEGNSSTDMPRGKVRIIAPEILNGGGTLYLLANVNADMVNVSPDKLRFVQTLDDLKNMTASLNQMVVERNGFFPMTGLAERISISGGQITADEGSEHKFPVMLTRLDAKVEFKIRVAEDYSAYSKDTKTRHTIKSFVPLSWQVVNLPRTAFVLPHDTDARDEEGKKEMFNTRELKFETRKLSEEDAFSYVQEKLIKVGQSYEYEYETDENGNYILDAEGNKIKKVETVEVGSPEIHGFSFYMLENRHDPDENYFSDKTKKTQIEGNNYHLRDKRNKDLAGVYDTSKGLWEFAPEEGTYLVVKGEIIMALNLDDEAVNQQLSADVVYYIHLGDFGGKDKNGDGKIDWDVNNYDIERNTSYTYMITIYGVDNIQLEVQTKTLENESGATGHVYVAKEKIYTFDSHYGSEVVSFDEKHLTDLDQMTWYVRTPFGREGKPYIINGVEVPSGLDYQWVKFKINSINNDGSYSHLHEKYHPEQVMDILEFSKYIKAQKQAFVDGKENAFRHEFDKVWLDWYNKENGTNISEEEARNDLTGVWYRDRIYLTIFVNEFYYDADPLTGDVRIDLWKDFVNQPPRLMHILCDADKSADEASLSTGSVVTIRQRSIQTVFNTEKPELQTAWGCETIDETRDALWYYSPDESYNDSGHWVKPAGASDIPSHDGNNSEDNGLYNTAKIWGLTSSGGYTLKEWEDYVDPDVDYDLCEDYRTLRYSCMMRNRDENGNGSIDAKEVKWYMASIRQLASLYVGDQGISPDAVLYPHDKQSDESTTIDDATNRFTWRLHIVSSTAFSDGYPEIMWAEEGLSTGSYQHSWGKAAGLSVRCVRNLGMDPATEEDAQKNLNNRTQIPEKAIQVIKPKGDINESSVFTFDLTNLNPLSIRYYTSQELEPNNEFSVEARPYWVFETGLLSHDPYSYPDLYKLIREGKSPCPEGYRTPNIREGALMSLNIENDGKWQRQGTYGRVSTYYSHGNTTVEGNKTGSGQDLGSNSWLFDPERVRLDEGGSYKVRCVRDVRQ